MHYLDLGPQVQSLNKLIKLTTTGKAPDPLLTNFQLEADINKGGKITQVLSPNQWVLVQVAKEPISSKGPRITSELSLQEGLLYSCHFLKWYRFHRKLKAPKKDKD